MVDGMMKDARLTDIIFVKWKLSMYLSLTYFLLQKRYADCNIIFLLFSTKTILDFLDAKKLLYANHTFKYIMI